MTTTTKTVTVTSNFRITSRAGVDHGVYAGATEAHALAAMHRDAGYDVSVDDEGRLIFASDDDRALCGDGEVWEITLVDDEDDDEDDDEISRPDWSPSEAWDRLVGDQTVAVFLALSETLDEEDAVDAYLDEAADLLGDTDRDHAAALLVRYIESQ